MGFTEKELEQIKYALVYLHDADLTNYGEENIKTLDGLMDKLNLEYLPWLGIFE